jgi:hypothetical protein
VDLPIVVEARAAWGARDLMRAGYLLHRERFRRSLIEAGREPCHETLAAYMADGGAAGVATYDAAVVTLAMTCPPAVASSCGAYQTLTRRIALDSAEIYCYDANGNLVGIAALTSDGRPYCEIGDPSFVLPDCPTPTLDAGCAQDAPAD